MRRLRHMCHPWAGQPRAAPPSKGHQICGDTSPAATRSACLGAVPARQSPIGRVPPVSLQQRGGGRLSHWLGITTLGYFILRGLILSRLMRHSSRGIQEQLSSMKFKTNSWLSIQTALPILSLSSNLKHFNQKRLVLEFVFKMQFSIFATIGAALLTYPANVYAQETTLSSSLPTTTATDTYTMTTTQGLDCNTISECVITATGTCTTITTQGVNCPILSTCIVPDCLKIVLVTLLCGCASIFTSTTCATACPTDCAGTSYSTFFLPCTSTPLPSTSDNSTTSSKPTTTLNPHSTTSTTATANSAKKWRSDSALSGLIVAILGLL
jgi:hypothetical protein